MHTNKDIDYRLWPFGEITIPAGTPVIPADNLPDGGYWAEPWPDMSDEAESWERNYGFWIDPKDVSAA